MSAPAFSVVIPNWNGMAHLPTCLASLRAQTHPSFEVLVVDNGSTDESCAWIEQHHPAVRLVRLPTNRGFPAAVNAGLDASYGRFIALLNNDTRCDEHWLAALERGFDAHPAAGFAASKIVGLRDALRLAAAGDECRPNGVMRSRGDGAAASDYDQTELVFSASACASAYRREVFEQVGRFDDEFFFSFEDADWGFRAQLAGVQCVYLPRAIVQHFRSGSVTADAVKRMAIFHVCRNQAWFVLQNFPLSLLRRHAVALLRCQLAQVRTYFVKPDWRYPGEAVLGKLAALATLPRVLRKRRIAQSKRVVSDAYLSALLQPPAISPPLPKDGCEVSIVIPNWNRSDLLVECLHSLATSQATVEITVVDNASTDDSVARVRAEFPNVRLIVNEYNRGFAGACNQGLRVGVGRYALLFNNDAAFEPGGLDALVAYLERHPDFGAATCKQIDASTSEAMPPCATAFPSPKNLLLTRLVRLFNLPTRFPNARWWRGWLFLGDDPHVEQEAAHLTGSCFLIRREALEQIGLLDEGFAMYLEETDWCWRLRQAGWRLGYTPHGAFRHHLSASGQLRSDREALYFQSYCRFFGKHYGRMAVWLYRAEKVAFGLLKRAAS